MSVPNVTNVNRGEYVLAVHAVDAGALPWASVESLRKAAARARARAGAEARFTWLRRRGRFLWVRVDGALEELRRESRWEAARRLEALASEKGGNASW